MSINSNSELAEPSEEPMQVLRLLTRLPSICWLRRIVVIGLRPGQTLPEHIRWLTFVVNAADDQRRNPTLMTT